MHSNAVRRCSPAPLGSVLGLFRLFNFDDGRGILKGEAATAALAESSDSKIAKSARPEFRNFNCRSYCWGGG